MPGGHHKNKMVAYNATACAIGGPTSVACIDSGDTAYMLLATALVWLMTPGLAFFYGGLVREKNFLNTLYMSIVAIGASFRWLRQSC